MLQRLDMRHRLQPDQERLGVVEAGVGDIDEPQHLAEARQQLVDRGDGVACLVGEGERQVLGIAPRLGDRVAILGEAVEDGEREDDADDQAGAGRQSVGWPRPPARVRRPARSRAPTAVRAAAHAPHPPGGGLPGRRPPQRVRLRWSLGYD